MRDAVPAPLNDTSFDYTHGRDARIIDGAVLPCPLWITEVNIGVYELPKDLQPATEPREQWFKAKIHSVRLSRSRSLALSRARTPERFC
eukprot:COSAG03_NODE_2239_length_2969_cov_4.527526_1_plen_89_part_00